MSNFGKSQGRIADIDECRLGLKAILKEMQPMTVRQLFYQATVRGLFHKTEHGYNRVETDSVGLRKNGTIPYEWIVDNTRSIHQLLTFNNPAEALRFAANRYRKSLWTDTEVQIQIWLEKDALASTISPVTEPYDVPLMVAHGYSSLSFLHEAANELNPDRPAYIFHLGDYDPSGVDAGRKIDETLRELAPDVEFHFERIGVLEKHIKQWRLPSRPTKQTDSRAAGFGSKISVELDAITPQRLRALVQAAIDRHMPADRFAVLKKKEATERRRINQLVKTMGVRT